MAKSAKSPFAPDEKLQAQIAALGGDVVRIQPAISVAYSAVPNGAYKCVLYGPDATVIGRLCLLLRRVVVRRSYR